MWTRSRQYSTSDIAYTLEDELWCRDVINEFDSYRVETFIFISHFVIVCIKYGKTRYQRMYAKRLRYRSNWLSKHTRASSNQRRKAPTQIMKIWSVLYCLYRQRDLERLSRRVGEKYILYLYDDCKISREILWKLMVWAYRSMRWEFKPTSSWLQRSFHIHCITIGLVGSHLPEIRKYK